MSQKNFTNATGNWTVGSDDQINYSSSAKLEGTIQATDFLDADGKSIIGVSEFISTEGTNNISVGTLDTDGDYSTALGMKGPFGGFVYKNSVGVGMDAKASEMGVAVGWATEARKQGIAVGYNTRAWGDYSTALGPGSIVNLDHEYSVAIGKNASTEESQQVMFGTAPDAPYGKPLNLKTYGTMQASDFLDADGNSIIGAGGDPDWVHNNETNHNLILGWNPSTEFYYNDQVLLGNRVKGQAGSVAIGADADSGLLGVAIGSNAKTGESAVAIGEDATAGDNEFAIGKYISAVNFSGATVKAKDYLDADGNSIIGAGGDPWWVTATDDTLTFSSQILKVDFPKADLSASSASVEKITAYDFYDADFDVTIREQVFALNEQTRVGIMSRASRTGGTAVGNYAEANSDGGVAIGKMAHDDGSSGGIAIGEDSNISPDTEGAIAIGQGAWADSDYAIALGSGAQARANQFVISPHIQSVNFSGATVQATDFLDANGNSIKVDLSNYYTSTESNARYQPRGNYQPAGNYQPEGNYPQSTTVNTFVTLTQAQYDALPLKNSSTIYFIKE